MSDSNKWDNIRIAIVAFCCIAGLVSCEGISQFSRVRVHEAQAKEAQAEADTARARLALERLKKNQGE
jgi:hypothetical protein